MTAPETALLALARAAIHGETPADPDLSAADWDALFRLSERHMLVCL